MFWYVHIVAAQDDSSTVIARPGQDVELMCSVTGGVVAWEVNGVSYTPNDLQSGDLAGHNITLSNSIIVEDIIMSDTRNGSIYVCTIPQGPGMQDITSDPIALYVAGKCKTL